MALAVGSRLGSYEVVGALGAGGMGEVYRAVDTRLNRQVAIKVLPEAVRADPERVARFEREAKLLASLNHPNIAGIHGLERANDEQFIVMELVEGETLAEVIARRGTAEAESLRSRPRDSEAAPARGGGAPRGLEIEEALQIAKQIADALEAAHEAGVIHRDLKPANVKVRPDGTVKVLDFGLAKAFATDPLASSATLTNSPTVTSPASLTGVGVLLGTATYMSPEQARGTAVDKRADIWTFGCVLFEMMAGKPPFGGETLNDIVAAILKNEPEWRLLPDKTPWGIRRLLRRCLTKVPGQRLRDIGDARIEIQEEITDPVPQPAPGLSHSKQLARAVPWVLVLLSTIATVFLVISRLIPGRPTQSGHVTRLEVNLPLGVELSAVAAQNAAISPDGTRVVFIGVVAGRRQLYQRRLDEFDAVPLEGTEFVNSCFFSPDGRAVAFILGDRTLKKVTLADGLVVTLARDADFFGGGVWGPDDRITFARAGALWQVPASGGSPQQLTRLDADKPELFHAWPTVLSGRGQVILFASVTGTRRDAGRIEALSLATGERRVIVDSGIFPLHAPSGHLIFFRDGALVAAPFDVETLEMTGPPVRVLENLVVDVLGAPATAMSASGAFLFSPSSAATSRLVWVSRQGVEQPITEVRRPYQNPRLAPLGQRIAVGLVDGDLWLQDIARTTFAKITSNETVGNTYPVWTADGTGVVFRTRTGLYRAAVDGSSRPEAILDTSVADIPSSISADGETLAFQRVTASTSSDVYVVNLRGDPKPRAVVNTPAFEGGADFSPDGRWLAYASDESGQMQVYLRPFPGPDRKSPVSTQGGSSPRWSKDGKELFYRSGNRMMAVEVATDHELTLSRPQVLFEQRYAFGRTVTGANYDVAADSQRFVMVKEEAGAGRFNLVLNWTEELKRLVPPK